MPGASRTPLDLRPAWRAAVEWLARIGYGARGFVYVLVGLTTASAALELRPRAVGVQGAMVAFLEWPLGEVWLWGLAIGLAGFTLWRVVQAVLDADRQGTSFKGLFTRAGQLMSGAVYGAVGLTALEILDGIDDLREENQSADATAAMVLALPFGGWLLIAVALFVLAVGLGNVLRAVFDDFGRYLGGSQDTKRWAVPLARTGYFVRGLVFLPTGAFLFEAATDMTAARARSLGEAFELLEAQPFGDPLLIACSLGLMAFGLFAFVEARWRIIVVPDDAFRPSADRPQESPSAAR